MNSRSRCSKVAPWLLMRASIGSLSSLVQARFTETSGALTLYKKPSRIVLGPVSEVKSRCVRFFEEDNIEKISLIAAGLRRWFDKVRDRVRCKCLAISTGSLDSSGSPERSRYLYKL